ncbi:MAG: 50S ribosomal protein L6 [Treponema sp.]|nr:50S ribosomal protein L6 [Treponema sp.]
MASKIGKLPVAIPAGVTVTVAPNLVTVKGPKGELKQDVNNLVTVEVKGAEVTVTPANVSKGEMKAASAAHGLYRNLIFNMIKGVSVGYSKSLVITGVGYRAEVQGKHLVMNLGYSSEFIAIIPEGLTVTVDKDGKITISGISKQQVGEFSSQIRKLRAPEPYKGKGIRYDNEVIRRKVGKTGVK